MSEHSGRGQGHQTSARVVEQPMREEGVVRAGETPITHEHPEDWGWHGEMGKWGRRLVWLPIVSLLVMLVGNHEGRVEDLWLLALALTMVGIALWDVRRRKNSWRSR